MGLDNKLTCKIILDDLDQFFDFNVYNNFAYSVDEIIDYVKRVFNYEKNEDEIMKQYLEKQGK